MATTNEVVRQLEGECYISHVKIAQYGSVARVKYDLVRTFTYVYEIFIDNKWLEVTRGQLINHLNTIRYDLYYLN